MKLRNTTVNTVSREGRDKAILQNLVLVDNLARRLRSRVPPSVTLDDLASAGTIGLIEAVERFDPSRGLKLRSYAQHRIWGAMLDFLRGEDPLSRSERRRVRVSDSTAPKTVSFDDLPVVALRWLATSGGYAVNSPAAVDTSRARRCLSSREDRVISLLFDFGWPNRRVAAELNVNESRVSQIKQRALSKLRAELAPVYASGAA